MKTNKIVLSFAAMAGLLAGLTHTPAHAALVTVSGTNVDFTYDDSLLALYGAPTVSGDNLFFSPTQFRTSSLNGLGMTSTSATTYIDIHAHDGYRFDSLALTEFGDYKLLGQNSFINVSGETLAIDKNNPPSSGPHATAFLGSSDNLSLNDGALHSWTATSQLDLTGSTWTDTTMLRVTLENLLDAYTSTGPCNQVSVQPQNIGRHSHDRYRRHGRKSLPSQAASVSDCGAQQAFIEKKFSGLSLEMTSAQPAAVPLPPALALFIPGLLSLLGFSIRRRGL